MPASIFILPAGLIPPWQPWHLVAQSRHILRHGVHSGNQRKAGDMRATYHPNRRGLLNLAVFAWLIFIRPSTPRIPILPLAIEQGWLV